MRRYKIFLFIFTLIYSLSFFNAFAETNTRAGFLPSNIWYSKDPFEEGDTIKIYTLVFNSDQKELSGSVLFFDNETLLGKKTFTASPSSVAQVSINWQVTAGDHLIFAKIENSRFLISAGKYQDVYLPENESEKSKRTVNKKIVPVVTTTKNSEEKTTTTDNSAISNIGNAIKEKTPAFIATPVVAAATGVDAYRASTDTKIATKASEVKKEIAVLGAEPSKTTKNKIEKPFKYVELFFLTLFSYIFSHKILFYFTLALLIFFAIRFIWRRFF